MKKVLILSLMAFCLQLSAHESLPDENPAILRATRISHVATGFRGNYLHAKFLVYGKKNDGVQMYLTL